MKNYFAMMLSVLGLWAMGQNDTLYLMKDGKIVARHSITPADLDSMIFYKPVVKLPPNGTFTDSRDGNVYKYVKKRTSKSGRVAIHNCA